ncbi:MAG: TerC family protein [Rickettsiaceae bacterium]|nr:TerC family protein [Rickettsiaceae bacterium]
MDDVMEKSIFMWGFFISVVLILLALDLGVFHKKDREIDFKESLWMSSFYILIAVIFGLWVWYIKGLDSFAEYITGFLVEKSLALDNIFLISLIFSSLSIPLKYQHRVLFWGILGVIVMRAVMIGVGAQIITRFEWILYIFAAFMIFTGIKMFFISHKPVEISQNLLLIWMKKHLNITDKLHDEKFWVYEIEPLSKTKKLFVTPLFISLIMVEFIDLVFAVDSIPAIFAITQDPYIVYTSNIFAILGLRALYFALASIIDRFYYLKYALAAVLIFIGSKIFIADALNLAKIPPMLSLTITFTILAFGILCSFIREKINEKRDNGNVNG